jgi:hypothetical protein
MEISQNGASPMPQSAMVTTSWMREDLTNGYKRFKLYAIHVPMLQAVTAMVRLDVPHPRLAGAPLVIGEAIIEVQNLDVAKIVHAALGEMLAKQPPEIIQVKGA